MNAKTVSQRVKQQRQCRLDEGWEEVRVWAPNSQAANAIRQFAESLRREAEKLPGLDEVCKSMDQDIYQRIKSAILQQGSSAYSAQSGAVLDLLSELAKEGNLLALSSAFNEFAKAKPGNMNFVESTIPTKILNNYLLLKLQLDYNSVEIWMSKNPNWESAVKQHLRTPEKFEKNIHDMADAIRQLAKKLRIDRQNTSPY